MTEKEILKNLIDNPKRPNISEWVYNVEDFLSDANLLTGESRELIQQIKYHGDFASFPNNLIAVLKRLYRKKYDNITIPEITKRTQIFVAMMFSSDSDVFYEQAIKPTIQSLNYTSMRIDEKEFVGSIIGEITDEIANSVALVADLTGNRGGVYYEAGIARGLQLCNHPIKLVLTCNRDYFDRERVHFDVQGDNIILYNDIEDYKNKLKARLNSVLVKDKKND